MIGIFFFFHTSGSFLIPEAQSGAGTLPTLITCLESPDILPKFNTFGFSQNSLEEVFVKVSSDAMDFKHFDDASVALKPLGTRVANKGWYLLANQVFAIIYCRMVQLAPTRSFMQLVVFFSLSFGIIILAGSMSAIQLPSPIQTTWSPQQPSLLLTPDIAFRNHLVST